MSRQSNRNQECNIYGEHYNDAAESIADASLNNDLVVASDSIGWTLSKHDLGDHVLPDQAAQTHGKTGSAKGGHTHNGDVEGGSNEVTNENAAYHG